MKIKEIITAAAVMLGRADIEEYLINNNAQDALAASGDVNNLVRCFNLVENEIALEYKPLIYSEKFITENGILKFENFEKMAIDIISISDEYENKVPYKLSGSQLKTKIGAVKVCYSYLPRRKELGGISDYKETEIPVRTMAMGVATEFSLTSSMFDEAVLWDKRFKDSLARLCSKKIKKLIPPRRWI